jgi:hypothetical protein
VIGSGRLFLTTLLVGSSVWGLKPHVNNPRLAKALHQEHVIREAQKALQRCGNGRLVETFDFRRYNLDVELAPEDEPLTGSVHMMEYLISNLRQAVVELGSHGVRPGTYVISVANPAGQATRTLTVKP